MTRYHDHVAICDGTACVTYAQLADRVQTIVAGLREAEAGPGGIIALDLGRCIDWIAGMLAVAATGNAWLAINRDHPVDRKRLLIRQAKSTALLTNSSTPLLGPDDHVQLINVNDLPSGGVFCDVQIRSDNLAYIIFTSGSTGAPKGVMIEHAALASFIDAMTNLLQPKPAQRFMCVAAPSFDTSMLEIFLALTTGGQVIMASSDETRDGRLLARALDRHQPDWLQATPATWRMLLASGWRGNQSMTLLSGAETLAPALAGELLQRCGSLWNLYGPTETTVWSTARKVERNDIDDPQISIGEPVDNGWIAILDEDRNPVTDGQTGELHIFGNGLAMGYLDRPDLTAERFVTIDGERAYRTGDRASLRPDGQIDFHGRIDHQIKINSQRIEPAEIECELRRCPHVVETVVGADAATPGGRLIAWVQAASNAPASDKLTRMLQEQMRQTLPAHMRPAVYILLDQFPLNTSGKVDRAALPAPKAPSSQTRELPSNDVERQIAGMVSSLLKRETVGRDENFFDAGGDSLSTVDLLLEVERAFGVEVPLADFLIQPTVAGLAGCLTSSNAKDSQPIVTLRPNGSRPALFFIHGAGGLAFTVFELALALESDRPVYALQDPACHPYIMPKHWVEDMAADLAAVINRQQPDGGIHLCGHSFGGLLAYEIGRQLALQGRHIALVGMIDTPSPPTVQHHGTWRQRISQIWRDVKFTGQIVTEAGPMMLDGCYMLFGAASKRHSAQQKRASVGSMLRHAWSSAMFRLVNRPRSAGDNEGLAGALDSDSPLLLMRQPGFRRAIRLTGIHQKARGKYYPQPSSFDIRMFRAEIASAETQGFDDPEMGWQQLTSGGSVAKNPKFSQTLYFKEILINVRFQVAPF